MLVIKGIVSLFEKWALLNLRQNREGFLLWDVNDGIEMKSYQVKQYGNVNQY